MFTIDISYWAMSSLRWLMDLIFQGSMQYCSWQHQPLLSPPDTSIAEHQSCFGPASSFSLHLSAIPLRSSKLDTFQQGALIFQFHTLFLSYCSLWQECWRSLPSPPQWTTFCQNSSLWSIHLGWTCTAWPITSLSYASPFTKTRLWSMKGFILS